MSDITQRVGQRLVQQLTRPCFALPLVMVSIALLAFSLMRLSRACGTAVPVHASELRPIPAGAEVVSAETVTELQTIARTAAEQLVHDRAEVPRILSRLEQSARALGLQIDISIKPSRTNAAGFQELIIRPVLIRLEHRDQPAFPRVLEWLRHASTTGRKVEVNALTLQSQAEGLASAQAELYFWSINTHEQSAAK